MIQRSEVSVDFFNISHGHELSLTKTIKMLIVLLLLQADVVVRECFANTFSMNILNLLVIVIYFLIMLKKIKNCNKNCHLGNQISFKTCLLWHFSV